MRPPGPPVPGLPALAENNFAALTPYLPFQFTAAPRPALSCPCHGPPRPPAATLGSAGLLRGPAVGHLSQSGRRRGRGGPIPRTGCDNAALCSAQRTIVPLSGVAQRRARSRHPKGLTGRQPQSAWGKWATTRSGGASCRLCANRQLLTHHWHSAGGCVPSSFLLLEAASASARCAAAMCRPTSFRWTEMGTFITQK